MDLVRPVEALIPGVRGAILSTLLGAGRPLSTTTVARLATVSTAQAARVLGQLTELGIVRREDVPPSVLHEPVEGNLVVQILRELNGARERVVARARELARDIEPAPAHLSIFGSLARGQATALSDIDVLAARPPNADDDDRWIESLDAWNRSVSEFAGNAVSILEVSEQEWRARRRDEPLWRTIERDEIVLIDSLEES